MSKKFKSELVRGYCTLCGHWNDDLIYMNPKQVGGNHSVQCRDCCEGVRPCSCEEQRWLKRNTREALVEILAEFLRDKIMLPNLKVGLEAEGVRKAKLEKKIERTYDELREDSKGAYRAAAIKCLLFVTERFKPRATGNYERLFKDMIFMGNGDHSRDRSYDLMARLWSAFSPLCGAQQVSIADGEEEWALVNTIAQDIGCALTGEEWAPIPSPEGLSTKLDKVRKK